MVVNVADVVADVVVDVVVVVVVVIVVVIALASPRALWFFFCLLYTSPSPRDATLSRMPSSA